VVDSQPEIAGRVSGLSSCAAVTFSCSSGYTDDHGHGTATASIAAGQLNANDMMSGVAPAATVLAEKVLDASGSGYDSDVANGIVKAADAGAPVISLSLTYIPTQAVVDAINYATGKGAVIVWAGGNASSPLNGGADTLGLSQTALTHLIVVGSVDSSNALSSFSNTPGSGNAVGASSSVSYASIWLMAPGENIVAPGIQFGADVYAYWTGTSMSTPEVAGAVALLEATWPILKTNGTAAGVLFASATDLGATGVDSTFGNGLLNIAKAFQPVGPLGVVTASGSQTPLGDGRGGLVGSGALGAMPFLRSQLSHYTAFDAFQRNFTVDLSGLVGTPRTSVNAQASFAPPLRSSTFASSAGRFMVLGSAPASFAQAAFGRDSALTWGDELFGRRQPAPAYLAFAGADGSFLAIGRGVSSSLSFAQAAWGADSLAARQADDLGVAGALVDLAQGGYSAAVGGQALGRLRIAASWSATPPPVGSAFASDRTRSDASAAAISLTAHLSRGLSLGLTYSALHEDNALLGATYAGGGLLDLGPHRQSRMLGVTTALELGGGRALLAEASFGETDGAAPAAGGLISRVSALKSQAWGVSFIQSDFMKRGDSVSLSVRQPLRVVAGEADLAITGVDARGYPLTSFAPVSLAPTGHETDVTVGYAAPASDRLSFRTALSWRSDADNVAGRSDLAFRFGINAAF
jgi:hypothetical protein